MADNTSLGAAKSAKNDEFYTQYGDIEAEMNAYVEYDPDVFRDKTILLPCDDPEWSNFTKYFASNFERFGLKKLISTSYAKGAANKQVTMFEMMSPLYDESKHEEHGKLFVLTRDTDGSGNIDMDDVEFSGYLEGDGDFRSAEVTALRDEADIIITNPPFSLFRPFLSWIMSANKQFIIIGNKNAITYKEVFPLIKENKAWIGYTPMSKDLLFTIPASVEKEMVNEKRLGSAYRIVNGQILGRSQSIWFTNIDHGKRHEELHLMTMAHNLKFNKRLKKKLENDYGKLEYPHYDNYDAIEVPFTECIPSDYKPCWYECAHAEECPYAKAEGLTDTEALCDDACNGAMGVPITYMDKHNPKQHEILGASESEGAGFSNGLFDDKKQTKQPVIGMDNATDRQTDRQTDRSGSTRGYSSVRRCNGLMGVPITFMDKYCSEQFNIVGVFNHGSDGPWDFAPAKCNGKERYKRIAIRWKV